MPRIRRCSRSGCWPDPPVQLARHTAFPKCASAGASTNETRLLVGPGVRRSAAPRAGGASRVLERQDAKVLGVDLAVFRVLRAQVEVSLCVQRLFDLGARGGVGSAQTGTTLAGGEPLLAFPFDVQKGMRVDQVVAVCP